MCLFCDFMHKKENIIYEDAFVYAIFDAFPVSKGHVLIITKRCVSDFFETNIYEKNAILEAIDLIKKSLDQLYHPDGYNIGINNGKSAGQTIFHCHIHLIPRYEGDTDHPKGGVRGVIPEKKSYDAK